MSKKKKEFPPVIRTLEPNPDWQPVAAICAWLLPGAGHFMLGQRVRGIIIGVTILMIFFAGLIIGGIGVLDYQQPPEGAGSKRKISFLGVWQPLTGPGLVGCWYKRSVDKKSLFDGTTLTLRYSEQPGYRPRFGFSYEIGVLYTAIAGMLNLLALVDVIFSDPKFRRENDRKKSGRDQGVSEVKVPEAS